MTPYKVVTLTDLHVGDRFKLVKLEDGSVTECVALALGTTSFNYRYVSGSVTRSVTDLSTVILLANQENPANWPPQANDVWAVVSRYSDTVNTYYHMVNGKLVCNEGHSTAPADWLVKYRYRGVRKLKLVFRNGKQVL